MREVSKHGIIFVRAQKVSKRVELINTAKQTENSKKRLLEFINACVDGRRTLSSFPGDTINELYFEMINLLNIFMRSRALKNGKKTIHLWEADGLTEKREISDQEKHKKIGLLLQTKKKHRDS